MWGSVKRGVGEEEEEEEERVLMELLDSAEGALRGQEALGKALASGWMDLASVRYAAGVHMLEHFKECAVNGKRLSGTPELRLFWDEGTQAWSLRAPPSPSAASSPPPETSSQPPETSTIPSGSSSQPPEISTIPPGSSSQPPEKPTDPPGTCGVATQASAEGNRQGSEAAEATGAATGAAGKAGKGRPAGQQQGLFYGPPALRNAALKFQGALSEVAQLLTDRNLLVAACHNQLRVQGRSPL